MLRSPLLVTLSSILSSEGGELTRADMEDPFSDWVTLEDASLSFKSRDVHERWYKGL